MAMYDNIVNLIQRPPEARSSMECLELVNWLKGKSRNLFSNVKYDVLTEIIRHCKFEKYQTDDIIIKQGERGDTLYIALQGDIAIYVNQKETTNDNDDKFNDEVLLIAQKAAEMKILDRSLLGTYVFGGSCLTFGEVALVEQDCIRTATVVANSPLDCLLIDRALFNRCLHGVVAEDMKAKSDFVDRNPMFALWPPRHRKQLVISFITHKFSYGDKITKQGAEADVVYFISSGEVEIHLEPKQYTTQYERGWKEIQKIFPDLITPEKGTTLPPHQERTNRLTPQRPQKICLLGENELLGGVEIMAGLNTFMETAVARSTVLLLKLRRSQFDRIFKKRYAAQALETIRNCLAQRICLYIYQCPPGDSAFLKYINIRLADDAHLKSLRKAMGTHDEGGVFSGAVRAKKNQTDKEIELIKRLHMPVAAGISNPSEDLTEIAMDNMEKRLRDWSRISQLNGSKVDLFHSHHMPNLVTSSSRK